MILAAIHKEPTAGAGPAFPHILEVVPSQQIAGRTGNWPQDKIQWEIGLRPVHAESFLVRLQFEMSKSFVQKSVENAKIIRGDLAMIRDGSRDPVQTLSQCHGALVN